MRTVLEVSDLEVGDQLIHIDNANYTAEVIAVGSTLAIIKVGKTHEMSIDNRNLFDYERVEEEST